MNPYVIALSFVVFLPVAGSLLLLLFSRESEVYIKGASLFITIVVFLVTVWMAFPPPAGWENAQFDTSVAEMQNVFNYEWIPTFNIQYYMGMDGISFPLLVLTKNVPIIEARMDTAPSTIG